MLHSEKARMMGSRMSTMKRNSLGSRALLWMFLSAWLGLGLGLGLGLASVGVLQAVGVLQRLLGAQLVG